MELLIYLAIVALVLVLMIGFLWDIILGSLKENSYQEVQQNARFVLTKINQEIKKATGINSPNPGESSGSISLAMASSFSDPIIIDLVNGKLRIAKGLFGPQELTSDSVVVTNLQFINLSYPDTPGTIRVEMTIERVNPANRTEYEAAVDLKSTVSLLPAGAAP